jgi:hypothetical protein|tara:strand:- start:1076 stop:1189 length:114 start_codon:yes stop_codon:yes gene_type:complete
MMWIYIIKDWIGLFGFKMNNDYYDIANPGKTLPAKGR